MMVMIVEVLRRRGHDHPQSTRGAQRAFGRGDAACSTPPSSNSIPRDDVGAIILTGADPAFCAGFDLRSLSTELRSVQQQRQRGAGQAPGPDARARHAGHRRHQRCRRDRRIGVGHVLRLPHRLGAGPLRRHPRPGRGAMPGGGMTIRLPQLIGIDRARRMTLHRRLHRRPDGL